MAPAPTTLTATPATLQPSPFGPKESLDQGPAAKDEKSSEGVQVLGAVGYGIASISRPDYARKSAEGVTIEAQLAYRFADEWALGLQVWGSETPVARLKSGKYGSPDSKNKMPETAEPTQVGYADCDTCTDRMSGGVVFAHSLRTVLIGPRLEFSPKALAGGYVGAGAGIGSVSLEDTTVAAGLTGRVGYRYDLAKAAALGLGLGFTGILVDTGHTWMPHAAIEVLLR